MTSMVGMYFGWRAAVYEGDIDAAYGCEFLLGASFNKRG
jgi:hypothetical protein